MAVETDTTEAQVLPEQPAAATSSEPDPKPATETDDAIARAVAEALAAERKRSDEALEAERKRAAEEAVAAERARVEAEAKQAQMSEQERLAAKLAEVEAERERERVAKTKAEAEKAETDARLAFVRGLQAKGLSLAQADEQLERLAFEHARALVLTDVPLDQAIERTRTEKPWMFRVEAPAQPTSTTTAAPKGARVEPPKPKGPPTDADVPNMTPEEFRAYLRARNIPSIPRR